MLPPPANEEADDEVVELALFDDISLDGVTSGADPTAWDPIRIEKKDEQEDDEDVLDTDMDSEEDQEGVTSGNDQIVGDVKSSERKSKKQD